MNKVFELVGRAVVGGLQQYLPFTVLKLYGANVLVEPKNVEVATVLTVYGIETLQYPSYQCFQF